VRFQHFLWRREAAAVVEIEAAVAAGARYLVSENSDLHEPSVMLHLNAHGVRVLYPHQFRKLVDLQRKGPPAT